MCVLRDVVRLTDPANLGPVTNLKSRLARPGYMLSIEILEPPALRYFLWQLKFLITQNSCRFISIENIE